MINTQLGSKTTLSAIRRQTGDGSLLAFMKMYLPHRASLPWSRMHREIASDYLRVGSGEPLRLALAAPDGYGKTTLTTYALVLWALAYKRCRCIAIGSYTRTAAGELLRDVDIELRTNTRLHVDFPHLAALQRGSGSSGSRASPPRDIYVHDVARLTTFGSTSSLTEITFEGSPPDLIILDGYDPNHEVNELRSEHDGIGLKLERQIHRRMITRMPNASLVTLGSLTHGNCLIDRLLAPDNSAIWTQRHYQAVKSYPVNFDHWFTWANLRISDPMKAQTYFAENRDQLLDGVEVLWPDHESFEQMMGLRALHGWIWFDRNRQGSPPFGCMRTGGFLGRSRYSSNQYGTTQSFLIDNAGYRREVRDIPREIGEDFLNLACEEEFPPQGRPVPDLEADGERGSKF